MKIDATSINSILSTISETFPDSIIGEDINGQIIIQTGLFSIGDPSTPLTTDTAFMNWMNAQPKYLNGMSLTIHPLPTTEQQA